MKNNQMKQNPTQYILPDSKQAFKNKKVSQFGDRLVAWRYTQNQEVDFNEN